jgi:hypothetical protein
MATQVLKQNKTGKYVAQARKRARFTDDWLEMEYNSDVDLLLILFSDKPASSSKGDELNGLVYNYDREKKLVSIEIIDFYGVFV